MKNVKSTFKSTLNFGWNGQFFVCSVGPVKKGSGRIRKGDKPKMITVDMFGQPSAKLMHPGHIRGTVSISCDYPIELNLKGVISLMNFLKAIKVKNGGKNGTTR